ncbi:MAG: hypothetical protein A2Z35_03465 [Actinobacteria bacterium RBG_19FT_COMBO_36_27]|nr:MAG: hypothetical protein A2Z35_03465 [Actinobacteria bacterium RBG_19FT_COMBO_36_27]
MNLFKTGGRLNNIAVKTNYSILVSQIGYRPCDKKMAFIRNEIYKKNFKSDLGEFLVKNSHDDTVVYKNKITHWGNKWNINFWSIDFSKFNMGGLFYLEVPKINLKSENFEIKNNIFRKKTLLETSIRQLEKKLGNKKGWQDCGSDLRALEGTSVQLIGLIDSFTSFKKILNINQSDDFRKHIEVGCDYLISCQREDGSFMNELYVAKDKNNWTLCMLAVIALVKAFSITNKIDHLASSRKGWEWCINKCKYTDDEIIEEIEETRKLFGKYEPWLPPRGLRTRDKLLIIWAGTELYANTNDLKFKNIAIDYANKIALKLQFLELSESCKVFYGNFYAWDNSDLYQKSWEHIGWGYCCGSVLPDEISGIINLVKMFKNDKSWIRWWYFLKQYAYGYLKQTSKLTPFGIYPLGVFGSEIRFFGPSWHGFNGVYGRIANLSMKLARLFEDYDLEQIALNNMQWIAGLNIGIRKKKGMFKGLSWIYGIGGNCVEAWTKIKGTIANGFCANPQFQLEHIDNQIDLPDYITTEDWIVHNGSWLSGLSELDKNSKLIIKTNYRGKTINAKIGFNEIKNFKIRKTKIKNNYEIYPLSYSRNLGIIANWDNKIIEKDFLIVSGDIKKIIIDFSDYIQGDIEFKINERECHIKVINKGIDNTNVKVILKTVGIKIKGSNKVKNSLKTGEKKIYKFHTEFENNYINKPILIRAEICSIYSKCILETGFNNCE